jgi:hypothetical protein
MSLFLLHHLGWVTSLLQKIVNTHIRKVDGETHPYDNILVYGCFTTLNFVFVLPLGRVTDTQQIILVRFQTLSIVNEPAPTKAETLLMFL